MSSVTLVHPAESVGRNEMPFGRDNRVVPGNIVFIVLDHREPGPHGTGDLGSNKVRYLMVLLHDEHVLRSAEVVAHYARASEQLDPRCSMQTYHRPISYTRPSPRSLYLLQISRLAKGRMLS